MKKARLLYTYEIRVAATCALCALNRSKRACRATRDGRALNKRSSRSRSSRVLGALIGNPKDVAPVTCCSVNLPYNRNTKY